MIANQNPAPSMEDVTTEAEPEQRSHVERLTGLRPAPKGFLGIEGHYHAGIRLSRSLEKNVVGVQFADDQKPTREGLDPENQRLRDRGFLYSGSRSNGSQTRKKGTGSRPCLNLSHRRFGLRAVCLSPFSVRNTSVIRCKIDRNRFSQRPLIDDQQSRRNLQSSGS
jgi:hypothetical protein